MIAGALALFAYVAWPTWTTTEVRPAIAAVLEAQGRYLGGLLAAYAPASRPDLKELDELRAAARLARSNSEAIVERMLVEPPASHAMPPRTAVSIVAATRRSALAALSLHAGLERDGRAVVPGIGDLALRVSSRLLLLATAIRSRSAPPRLSALRGAHVAEPTGSNAGVSDETDLIVDSIETTSELLAKDARTQSSGDASRITESSSRV